MLPPTINVAPTVQNKFRSNFVPNSLSFVDVDVNVTDVHISTQCYKTITAVSYGRKVSCNVIKHVYGRISRQQSHLAA